MTCAHIPWKETHLNRLDLSGSMIFSLVSVIIYYHCQSHPRMFSLWANRYVFNACIDLINHEPQSHSPVHDLCLYDC